MKLFTFVALFTVGGFATPTPRSLPYVIDPSEPLDELRAHVRTDQTRSVTEEHISDMLSSQVDDYEQLVALCEAGFVSGCQAAVHRQE